MWCAMYTNKHCSYSGKKSYPVVRCKSHPHADSLEIFYGCELVKAPPKKLFVDLYQTLPRYLCDSCYFIIVSSLSLWGKFLANLDLWTNNVLTYLVIEFKLESNRFIRRYDTWVILEIFLLFRTMVHTLHVCVRTIPCRRSFMRCNLQIYPLPLSVNTSGISDVCRRFISVSCIFTSSTFYSCWQ